MTTSVLALFSDSEHCCRRLTCWRTGDSARFSRSSDQMWFMSICFSRSSTLTQDNSRPVQCALVEIDLSYRNQAVAVRQQLPGVPRCRLLPQPRDTCPGLVAAYVSVEISASLASRFGQNCRRQRSRQTPFGCRRDSISRHGPKWSCRSAAPLCTPCCGICCSSGSGKRDGRFGAGVCQSSQQSSLRTTAARGRRPGMAPRKAAQRQSGSRRFCRHPKIRFQPSLWKR